MEGGEVSLAPFDVKTKLGVGAYGAVYLAVRKGTEEKVAIKIVEIPQQEKRNSLSRSDAGSISQEIQILKLAAKCPYIVSLSGTYAGKDSIWLVLEYCDGGALGPLLRHLGSGLTEEQIAAVAWQVLQGLAFLHSRKIVHRDIKAENILLKSSGEVKLADFGIATDLNKVDNEPNSELGSPYWIAPELCQGLQFSTSLDIWSLGITLIELAQVSPPYYDLLPFRALYLIGDADTPPPTLTDHERWSTQFHDFIAKCLLKDPTARATATELLKHPFLANIADRSHDIIKTLAQQSKMACKEGVQLSASSVQNLLNMDISEEALQIESDSFFQDDFVLVENEDTNIVVRQTQSRIDTLEQLVTLLRDPERGLKIKRRRYRVRTYPNCFVGREAVDWMVKNLNLRTRQEAVAIGEILMQRGIIRHVLDTEPFADRYYFYAFADAIQHRQSVSTSSIENTEIQTLIKLMRDPIVGLNIQDRKWRFRKYPKCFVGSEAVSWMMDTLRLYSREEAVRIGQLLIQRGVLHHVTNDQDFEDKYLFYRFYFDEDKYEAISSSAREKANILASSPS